MRAAPQNTSGHTSRGGPTSLSERVLASLRYRFSLRYFGETALIAHVQRELTATALEDSVLLLFQLEASA